jgi:hypothetical protein
MVRRLLAHARRNLVAYVALALALTVTAGVAYSAIPDSGGVIHGCYDNAGGALRVIDTDAGGVCRGGETALDWNQQGPAGVTGATGAQGPQGPPGLATVYGKSAGGPVQLPHKGGETKTVVSMTVPRGSYVITGKAVGGFSLNEPDCPPNSGLLICSPEYILKKRIAARIFGCAVIAGTSSDLGRANLITGGNQVNAFQTVSANVIHTFTGPSNKITLTCLQYAGGVIDMEITNARLIAMRVDRVNPINAFRAVAVKLRRPKNRLNFRLKP